jgi:hypothetical protein
MRRWIGRSISTRTSLSVTSIVPAGRRDRDDRTLAETLAKVERSFETTQAGTQYDDTRNRLSVLHVGRCAATDAPRTSRRPPFPCGALRANALHRDAGIAPWAAPTLGFKSDVEASRCGRRDACRPLAVARTPALRHQPGPPKREPQSRGCELARGPRAGRLRLSINVSHFTEAAAVGESVLTTQPNGPAADEIRRLYREVIK